MKSLALSLLLAVSLTLAACGSDEAGTDATGSESAVDTAADAQMTEPEADAGAAADMDDAAADAGADTSQEAAPVDVSAILGDGAIETDEGLRYVDEVVGEGPAAEAGNTVSVHYTGTFEDGSKFDSSLDRGTPFDFPLGAGAVIKGWDLGVAGMQAGGKRKMWIPSEMAYGEAGFPGAIPPNTPLVFEVELLEIK